MGTEQDSCFCQGAGQRTVNLVCSLDFLRRHSHYCIQAEGRARRVVVLTLANETSAVSS